MQSLSGSAPAPLADVRVLDLSESLAGPFCTQILADMGADVIKVERPGGDAARGWGPPFCGDDSAIFMSANRNKRSIALDVRSEAGLEIVERLAARADVVVQSFRHGVAEALGLGPERLRGRDTRLIYCSISAYGPEGPLRDARGYDPLAQAYGGLMSVTGHPGQAPVRIGVSAVDMGTGMWGALGILAALRTRERTGQGARVEVSLLETALMWMSYHLIGYLGAGAVPEPQGSGLGLIAPYEAFPTADGWVMIAAGTDAQFQRLCGALALTDLAGDGALADNAGRVSQRARLAERITRATRPFPGGDLVQRLRAAGVPCAPVLGVPELVAEPQVAATGAIVNAPHPALGEYRSVALPILWDGARPPVRSAPPGRSGHATEVLLEAGYDAADVARLAAAGVVEIEP